MQCSKQCALWQQNASSVHSADITKFLALLAAGRIPTWADGSQHGLTVCWPSTPGMSSAKLLLKLPSTISSKLPHQWVQLDSSLPAACSRQALLSIVLAVVCCPAGDPAVRCHE